MHSSIVVAFLLALQVATPPTVPDPAPVRVRVEGVRGDVRTNVRLQLSILQQAGADSLPEHRVRRLHERAPDEIRLALRPFGHYRPRVTADLRHDGRRWLARYRIDPGEPVRLTAVEVRVEGEGAEDPALQGIFARHRIRTGAPLRHAAYEAAKQALQNRAAAHGYLDAALTENRVEVDTVAGTARVRIGMRTGPRYRFGEVRFADTPFRGPFLDRFVGFAVGDPFRLEDLVLLQRELSASGLFEQVEVEPDRAAARGLEVPIEVRLRLRRRTSFVVGAGYGTDTGPRGTAMLGRRWLNDAGHAFRAELQGSGPIQALMARYTVPVGSRSGDEMAASLSYRRERFEDVETRVLSASVGAAYGRGGWRETPALRLAEEWFVVAGAARTSTLVLPSIAWSRVRADDPSYARRGSRIELGVLGTAEAIGSDLSMLQGTARLRLHRGLHGSGRLLIRLDAGATAVGDFPDVPLSFRFFAGGDRSVRGFDFRSLAPRGADGGLLGGRHLLTSSVELEQMLVGPFGVALFTDAGGAFDRLVSPDGLRQGAGGGLRWRSPIGPVRLDVAWPLGEAPGRPHLHFAIGGAL